MKITIHQPPAGARRVKFYVPYKALEWRNAIKEIPTRIYHKDQRLWSIRNEKILVDQLKKIAGKDLSLRQAETGKVYVPIPLSDLAKDKLALYEQKLTLIAYSQSTISNYKLTFTKFLAQNQETDIDNLSKEDLEKYVYNMIVTYKISQSKQNIIINALKFYYEKVLGKPH